MKYTRDDEPREKTDIQLLEKIQPQKEELTGKIDEKNTDKTPKKPIKKNHTKSNKSTMAKI